MRARYVFGLVLIAGLGWGVGSAQAQEISIAVAPFRGRRAAPVTRVVAEALGERGTVVGTAETRRVARQAQVRGLDASAVPHLAEVLGADLVVLGEVRGPRRRTRVTVAIFTPDGTELGRGEVAYRPARRTALTEEVHRLFDLGQIAVEALRAPPPPPEPMPEPEPEPEAESVPDDGLAFLDITVGFVIRSRSAAVNIIGSGQRLYDAAPYAELTLAAELRPLAGQAHLGRGVFARGRFAHSVGLGSRVDDPMMAAVKTNFLRFEVAAGWLGPVTPEVEVGVALGGGLDGYFLAPNPALPTTEIGYVRPAARARIRLAEETLVLDAHLGYRGVVGLGALGRAFGEGAETHGVDVGLGLTGHLLRLAELGLRWRVLLEYVGYFTSFSGRAADAAATSGSEESLRLTIDVGWSF